MRLRSFLAFSVLVSAMVACAEDEGLVPVTPLQNIAYTTNVYLGGPPPPKPSAPPVKKPAYPLAAEWGCDQHSWRLSPSLADSLWDAEPVPGSADVRLVVKEGGAPLRGTEGIGITGRFRFSATQGPSGAGQCFNPDTKGRFVAVGIMPGTYRISVMDSQAVYRPWMKDGVELTPGAVQTFTLDLVKGEVN